jgi:hypothetical protein
MESLYELARINNRYKRISDSMLPINEDSSLRKLYEIVFSQRILTDEAAMFEVYGKKNLGAFSRLKSRLKDSLVRTTILQNTHVEAEDSRINESLNGYRQTLVSRVLIANKSKNLGIDLAEKSIARSIKYHATENVILQSRILVNHYGASEYNKYKFNKYLAIQQKYLHIHEWEIKAEHYFVELQRVQLKSLAGPSDTIKSKAKEYVDELDSANIRSYAFNLTKYRVKAAYYEYMRDYNSLLKISENASKEFSAPDFKSGNALFNINLRRAWALIQAGRFEEATHLGSQEMNKTPVGTLGWFLMGHYTLKGQLYNGDFEKAILLINRIIDNPRFKKIGESYQELFNVTLSYIYLIIESNMFGDLKGYLKMFPEFKIYKFLNTIPVFSKDKRGINVSILLMHIAYLLQHKDFNAIIDRVDSLNQYAYRYLRKDESFRSNCMIKMVVQMTKADFNPIRTVRYTEELLKQLEQVKLAGSGENIETEIIPYEVLWQIMKKSL